MIARAHVVFGIGCLLMSWLVAHPEAALAKRRGTQGEIRVKALVKGATVMLNGKKIGVTPLKRGSMVSPGTYTVTVSKLGYLEHTEQVRVAVGKVAHVTADLLPFAGVLNVRTNVQNARVLVNGQEVGRTPLETEIDPGDHQIEIKADGYAPYHTVISAVPGQVAVVRAKLTAGADDTGLDLALIPLEGPGGDASSSNDDELDLLPLEGLVPVPGSAPPQDGGVLATGPTELGVGATLQAPQPWYNEWWVWTAVGAVVVTGVTIGIVAASRGRGGGGCGFDACWSPLGEDGLVLGQALRF